MISKIIKDIRYSESEVENIDGHSLSGSFGDIYKKTTETVAVGQRIPRKLNELKFSSGVFDHIDINFTTTLLRHLKYCRLQYLQHLN